MNSGRAPFYLCWLYATFSTLVLFSEYSLIPPNDRFIYVAVKMFLVWICVPCGFILRRKPDAFWATAIVGVSMMLYPAFCGYWRINYEMAVFELMVGYALAFKPPRWFYAFVAVGCAVLFSWVRLARFSYLQAQFTNPAPLDGVLAAFAMGSISIIFYVFLNYQRNWRAAALARFGLIGQHASNIIHDVKNLISAPAVHAATLQRVLADHPSPAVREILEEMQASLTRTRRLVLDLNEMARLTEGGQITKVSLRTLVHEVTDFLENQMRGIAIEIQGDLELNADRALLYSVLMSIFMNAADQFQKSPVERPVIVVSFGGGFCRVTDNGGGFDVSVLESLSNGGYSSTTKSGGSGMGLYLVSNALNEIGGRVSFSNTEGGAVVELRFAT